MGIQKSDWGVVVERRSTRRVDVSPADVGRRVTLRYRQDALGLTHGEAAGVLDRWSGAGKHGILMLRRRDDTTVRIPYDQVEVARIVPPELSAYAMEATAEEIWPPNEYEDAGHWRLRWTHGITGRANSVRVAGPADRGFLAALEYVEQWYTERGGIPLLQVPDPSPMDEYFDEAGWTIQRRSRFMVNSTERLRNAVGTAAARADMVLTASAEPDPDWIDLLVGDDADARREMELILQHPNEDAFVCCRSIDSGEMLGIGRGTIVGEWAGASAMVTAPGARRRGVGTAVMTKLAEWSQERGIAQWFLQVFSDSEPALALYDGLGFTIHHEYAYRAPAAETIR